MRRAAAKDVPAFDGARSFGLYTGNLRQAILRLKFAGDERLGARLGEIAGVRLGFVATGES